MRHFPIFLEFAGRDVLVVGGGLAALAKVRLLRDARARISLVAPRVHPDLADLARAGSLRWLARSFEADDVRVQALVFAADEGPVNRAVVRAAKARGVLINVVDAPEHSNFILPAIVDRDPITIAVGSGGSAPLLARKIRAEIERLLPGRLGELTRFASSFRESVKALIRDPLSRRRFWQRFFDGPIARALLSGQARLAREQMITALNRADAGKLEPGLVSLIGAGPGDPDLLTLRALRALEAADVVVYDRLIDPRILNFARRDAERIFVGKARGRQSLPQADINALLAHLAEAGKRVARLKGGDPFIFGRGGEEAAFLRGRGVAVEIVPGITAATGCAAAAGIPLTHRDFAHGLVLATGQGRNGVPDLDWAALASRRQTLAIYMGLANVALIADRLIAHGLDPKTPAALIENGTRDTQRAFVTSLAELGQTARAEEVEGPALIVIGDVVRLADASALTLPRAPTAAIARRA
jgi:uroporphyrin-III C-methyltransferase/precorrin-2 dehydrogenase/sirohydrochlorin ferrochelatase